MGDYVFLVQRVSSRGSAKLKSTWVNPRRKKNRVADVLVEEVKDINQETPSEVEKAVSASSHSPNLGALIDEPAAQVNVPKGFIRQETSDIAALGSSFRSATTLPLQVTTNQGDPRITRHDERELAGGDSAIVTKQVKILLDYDQVAADAWVRVQEMPNKYQNLFLQSLDQDIGQNVEDLLVYIMEERQKELRPYEDDAANTALEDVRTIGPEAEREFKEVYSTLGSRANLELVIEKIESRFGQTARTKERVAAEKKELVERLAAERAATWRKEREAREAWRQEREAREESLRRLAEEQRKDEEARELAILEMEEAWGRDRAQQDANRPIIIRIIRTGLSMFWHLSALGKVRAVAALALFITFFIYALG